jgi:branched-chain amino acid transport system permease protein/neutral amino acid transport system permease protein
VDLFVAAFGFGLVSMSVIAIAAVGFTMQFGITNMINLAYGQVMIVSAYAAYAVNRTGISIWISLIGGALFGALLSFVLNRVLYTPFLRRGTAPIAMVIISLAAALMIANVMLPIVGYFSVSYNQNPGPTIRLGAFVLTTSQILIIGLAVGLMLLIHALLTFTRLGKAMRATAANLCGVAGTVAGMNSESFAVASGAGFLIPIIAAAVLGGAGQPYGAMIGAILIGEVTELSAAAISPQFKEVVAFGILVLVMVFRPQGLLAKRGALAAAG